ncbi:MAG: SUMF1/EgtB/PvdO family nonheme iron enzyme [Bacteroidales bacterium]|jgi:formylglycine-generating enzyme required for sulfatase activity|nr:SUMF1/EgtB/PvdO family nonheme iron enzyme [Bacteroidales bacterium]
MKKLFIINICLIVLSSCNYKGNGELVGVERKAWFTPDPYGMLFIKPGSFQMGPSDQDVPYAMTAQTRRVTISAFWMDETEITNSEYRQFVNWVRDSLALQTLGKETKNGTDFGDINTNSRKPLTAQDFVIDASDVSETDANFLTNMYENGEFDFDNQDTYNFLDWSGPLDYSNLEIIGILAKNEVPNNFNQSLYIAPPAELYRYTRSIDLNTDALYYEYFWQDLKQAAQKATFQSTSDGINQDVARSFNREKDHGLRIGRHFNPTTGQYEGEIKDKEKLDEEKPWDDFANREVKNYDGRNDAGRHGGRYNFVMHEKVHIYPDTLCWISDFTYGYNEPMAKAYFWHPAYDNYPVVGVSWKQASAFCVWRTQLKNSYQRSNREAALQDYRLPTEAEWEYAARGGRQDGMYPWGGNYTRNYQGCFVANFKPVRGAYSDDGGVYTVMVASYDPNDWGLYDMAGNVAEWTSNAFDESAYNFTHDLNPDNYYYAHPDDPPAKKRKVVRGGSWKDVAYYLQNGTRTFEYQDSAKSYIGFRCVREYLGRSREDKGSTSQIYN